LQAATSPSPVKPLDVQCGRCGALLDVDNDAGAAQGALKRVLADIEPDVRDALLAARTPKTVCVAVGRDRGVDVVLRAFSGDLAGVADWRGWVPSALRRERTASLEQTTLEALKTADVPTRRALSRTLMQAMHDAASLTSRGGLTLPLRQVFVGGGGMPSGTADCALPKLLHHANERQIDVLGFVEVVFSRQFDDLQIVEPCASRCLPILGFLLCPTC
jgi:hypothetical protein